MPRRQLSAAADAVSWYCALALVALMLVIAMREEAVEVGDPMVMAGMQGRLAGLRRPCDEIYVVGEGETLHTISDKCGDPFIVERNPHIHDPDDVFPGLVIKLQPSKT